MAACRHLDGRVRPDAESSPVPQQGIGRAGRTALAVALAFIVLPTLAQAYVGPGAGIALFTTSAAMLVTFLVAGAAIFAWPFRMTWRFLRRKKRGKPWAKRLIIVGLDGQDPRLTDRFIQQGKLPNFKKLAESGSYERLRTTFPSVSPVAWSSFSTGTEPAKHNIFDFLDRDRRTYLPVLSSTHIGSVESAVKFAGLTLWKRIQPEIRLLRKSRPFWSILGDYHIWSTVLRVPITFPPDRFYGAQLSAMCVPDLLGTQGTFFLLTTRPSTGKYKEGGLRIEVERRDGRVEAVLEGPEVGDRVMTLPIRVDLESPGSGSATVRLKDERLTLKLGELSEWVKLTFRAGRRKATGICRMLVTEMDEHFSLYITPISLDPEAPVMPVSHPSYYSSYLTKKIGLFSTLGLAEDTWALNEGVVGDEVFLKQTYDVDRERESMFFAAMDKLRKGALVCVWDGTDRIQHMFWRYLEEGHPAARGKEDAKHKNAIEELYKHNDALVGRVMDKLKDGDVMMVVSDHGFTSFRRGVNINAWLLANGYLKLKEGADGAAEWLRDVDWAQTKAYALGLTGMFLNIKGREEQGIVEPGEEVQNLKKEIAAGLTGLMDEEKEEEGVTEAFITESLYKGPYVVNAPDLLIGYNSGYRTSWDCATGVVAGPVFEDNTKAWSGDHCVDPRQVPGIFFCNRKIDNDDPALIDIAPSALEMFGVTPPAHMDGRSLFRSGAAE